MIEVSKPVKKWVKLSALCGTVGMLIGITGCSQKSPEPLQPGVPAVDSSKPPPEALDLKNRADAAKTAANGQK